MTQHTQQGSIVLILCLFYMLAHLLFCCVQCWVIETIRLTHKHTHTHTLIRLSVLFWHVFFPFLTTAVPQFPLICRSHVFRVGEGEAEELVLVQVHYDKFVRRRQVDGHLGELLVKVASVPTVPLQDGRGVVGVRDVEVDGGKWNGMRWEVRRRREDSFVTSLNVIGSSSTFKGGTFVFIWAAF